MINKDMFNSLKKQYGIKKATQIYSAMENEGKASFKKGMKTATKKKRVLKRFPKK